MTIQPIRLISLFLLGHLYIIPMAIAKVAQNEKVLQSVANLDQFQSTEGNQIRLIQTAQGCRIEVIFYREIGKIKKTIFFHSSKIKPNYSMLLVMNIITAMVDSAIYLKIKEFLKLR